MSAIATAATLSLPISLSRSSKFTNKKVVEVLNSFAREYKSLKKELAELQDELAQAGKQVHISEAKVSTALDRLAYLEELVNDKLLQDKTTIEPDRSSPSASTSTVSVDTVKSKLPRKSLNVSGPFPSYHHPRLKNFWYPVAFSTNLKDDTMVLNEDLRLVIGQQDRMLNGANLWNFPVSYDKLGVRYKLWRDAVEQRAKQLPFTNEHKS